MKRATTRPLGSRPDSRSCLSDGSKPNLCPGPTERVEGRPAPKYYCTASSTGYNGMGDACPAPTCWHGAGGGSDAEKNPAACDCVPFRGCASSGLGGWRRVRRRGVQLGGPRLQAPPRSGVALSRDGRGHGRRSGVPALRHKWAYGPRACLGSCAIADSADCQRSGAQGDFSLGGDVPGYEGQWFSPARRPNRPGLWL